MSWSRRSGRAAELVISGLIVAVVVLETLASLLAVVRLGQPDVGFFRSVTIDGLALLDGEALYENPAVGYSGTLYVPGLPVVATGAGRWRLAVAVMALTAAIWTKQTTLVAAVAFAIWLAIESRRGRVGTRYALGVLTALAVLNGVVLAAGSVLTDGWLWRFVVELPRAHARINGLSELPGDRVAIRDAREAPRGGATAGDLPAARPLGGLLRPRQAGRPGQPVPRRRLGARAAGGVRMASGPIDHPRADRRGGGNGLRRGRVRVRDDHRPRAVSPRSSALPARGGAGRPAGLDSRSAAGAASGAIRTGPRSLSCAGPRPRCRRSSPRGRSRSPGRSASGRPTAEASVFAIEQQGRLHLEARAGSAGWRLRLTTPTGSRTLNISGDRALRLAITDGPTALTAGPTVNVAAPISAPTPLSLFGAAGGWPST